MDFGSSSRVKAKVPPVVITVKGIPVAQPRHRVSCRGAFPRVYLPTKHPVHEWKRAIILEAAKVTAETIEGAIRVNCLFVFPSPKSKKSQAGNYKFSKPDIDNLLKAVLTHSLRWRCGAMIRKLLKYIQPKCTVMRLKPLSELRR